MIAWLIVVGILIRVSWLVFVQREVSVAGGEAQNVAHSVFRDSTIADAFGRGSGLTAHINPILPIIAGHLYKAFGWGSLAAESILLTIALASVFGAALFLYKAFKLLGVPVYTCLGGLALFAVLPINLRHEVVMFRIWEGGLAAFILAFGIYQLVKADRTGDISLKQTVGYAATSALGLFVNPAAGLTLYAAGSVFLVRNWNPSLVLRSVIAGLIALVIVLGPWCIRNFEAFGRFIPLRSNAGLEIALANHPGALADRLPSDIFTDRWSAIHPNASQKTFDLMQRSGGELSYTAVLRNQAGEWIAAHPEQAARLSLQHLAQFYFPPSWLYEIWGGSNRGGSAKVLVVQGIALVALLFAIGMAVGLRDRWIYPMLFIVVPALPYALVQPTPRYHYLISTLAIFLFCAAIEYVRRGVARLT